MHAQERLRALLLLLVAVSQIMGATISRGLGQSLAPRPRQSSGAQLMVQHGDGREFIRGRQRGGLKLLPASASGPPPPPDGFVRHGV